MKISYITIGNAMDIHNWSGLEYNIAQTLQKHVGEVDFIGNLRIHKNPLLLPKCILYRLIGKRYDVVRDPSFALQCSQQVKRRLKPGCDLIFSPGSVATALLKTGTPKVIYSDATFAGLLDTYVSDYCSDTIKKGHYLEQKALESASLVFYSSDEAAASAIRHYDVDPSKIRVVPFGANLDHQFSGSEITEIVRNRSNKELHLLFMGVDWKRKGGDLAVKTVRKLHEGGIKATLHVAGIKYIPLNPLPDFVQDHGFISKATPAGREKILDLMKRCHFLFLPTRAEAYGLVFCEANAMGIPSVSTKVGGVPTIIRDDLNGRMFDLAENEDAYAEYLASWYGKLGSEAYENFALSSYQEYKNRLNWKTAGETIKAQLEGVLR